MANKTPEVDRATADALLRVNADHLTSTERDRIGHENRYRSLTEIWEVDGVRYGLGLSKMLPQVQQVAQQVERLQEQEKYAQRDLERVMKMHYLGDWAMNTHGIGMKQGARLIAAVGDPATRPNVRMLYSYLGLHVIPHPEDNNVGIAPFHQRGHKSNWNSQAQARVHMIAESCIKQTGPPDEFLTPLWCKKCTEDELCDQHDRRGTKRRSVFRDIYDEAREKYRDAVHPAVCRRCGPSGHPKPAGSPLTDGHKHARAVRIVKKEIIKDMWRAARATVSEPELLVLQRGFMEAREEAA